MEENTKQVADKVIFNTYARHPLVLVRGQGSTVYDDQGQAYTDFIAGVAVCNLGHAHPELASIVARQAQTLWHVSNLFYTEPQTRLARWLVDHSFADRVFFANSGAEANEAAIKLARKYCKENRSRDRYRVVSMRQSFHGRTMATLSATGQDKIRKGYDPILEGFDFVPYNDIDALRRAVGPKTCAVILEPIQGEGGVICPDPDFLPQVRRLCDEQGCLLIFDEVQTGIGRTGKLFAYEHFGVTPDIMTLAKALANGLPIGAMLATEKVAAAFAPGAHGSTFGGNSMATRVALGVVRILTEDGVLEQCRRTGAYFRGRLDELQQKHDRIKAVRGLGLLLGVELVGDGASLVKGCMENGYLINCVQDNILRLAPPLIITQDEIDGLIQCLDALLLDAAITTAAGTAE